MTKEEEISLKDLIYVFEDYFKELLRKRVFLFLVIMLFGLYFAVSSYFDPLKYRADLSFIVNEDDPSGAYSGLNSILGQFGLGGKNTGTYNLSKILELSKSRKISTLVLFEKVEIDGQSDFVANHILRKYELVEKLAKDDEDFKNFAFTHGDLDAFNRKENKVLLVLYKLIKGDSKNEVPGLLNSDFDEETGILYFTGITINEDLSLILTQLYYDKLSAYYVEKTIEKQKATYNVFKSKVDSLESSLKATNYALLKFEDSNRNLALKQYQAKKYQLQAESIKLGEAYTEAYKSLQITELALENKTPFITIIDSPILPLQKVKSVLLIELIKGLILGLILGSLFVVLRKFYVDGKHA